MEGIIHITSGDCAGEILVQAGLPGEIFVWHDILYDGPRNAGWPDEASLHARAHFLQEATAGGLGKEHILETLRNQYEKLAEAVGYESIVLWFDACLFDQAMLAHILACLHIKGAGNVELLCIAAFPGIEPFHGLGQLQAEQLASLYGERCPVTDEQFRFAEVVDEAFAIQDVALFRELSEKAESPFPWIAAAVARWMQEQPDPHSGLGRLEQLALAAINADCETPTKIFTAVAAADTPPQFWGDTTLWAKINGLADREPPLVQIQGPSNRLPQWGSEYPLSDFTVTALSNNQP